MDIVESKTIVKTSRDPDDDKFLGCAKDAKALYIVSGDKDLQSLSDKILSRNFARFLKCVQYFLTGRKLDIYFAHEWRYYTLVHKNIWMHLSLEG